jgi:UDP-3-O-[3-hydroxymyristoyl] glucosamine N-acyltransferase
MRLHAADHRRDRRPSQRKLRRGPHTVRPLSEATGDDLSFLANPRYVSQLASTRAAAVLVEKSVPGSSAAWIRVDEPYAALATVLRKWFDEPARPPGISPLAAIAASARIGLEVSIGPFVSVGDGCEVGDRVTILDGSVIGAECVIGDGTVIHPRVTLYRRSRIGRNCILHSGVVIGGDGFGFATSGMRHEKIPQVGIVRIEDDVEIGSGTTIDRAALGETVIGEGTKIDNLVQIAHNVRIGRHCLIVSQVGVSGSTEIGDHSVLGGQAGTYGHLSIGPATLLAARGVLTKDWEGHVTLAGNPARPLRAHQRSEALIRSLPGIVARLRRLEKRGDDERNEPQSGSTPQPERQ